MRAMSQVVIDIMQAADWEQVRTIYWEGIATGHATFETEAPSWEQWTRRIFAARDWWPAPAAKPAASPAGAALSPVSQRCVYGGVAEVSVYVSQAHRQSGVGRRLLSALIRESERNGVWTLQAGMFPENAGSLALHRGCGFREVGRRERIGKLNGAWRDTILLERRSPVVGVT